MFQYQQREFANFIFIKSIHGIFSHDMFWNN